jgi:hypothetical protein
MKKMSISLAVLAIVFSLASAFTSVNQTTYDPGWFHVKSNVTLTSFPVYFTDFDNPEAPATSSEGELFSDCIGEGQICALKFDRDNVATSGQVEETELLDAIIYRED